MACNGHQKFYEISQQFYSKIIKRECNDSKTLYLHPSLTSVRLWRMRMWP